MTSRVIVLRARDGVALRAKVTLRLDEPQTQATADELGEVCADLVRLVVREAPSASAVLGLENAIGIEVAARMPKEPVPIRGVEIAGLHIVGQPGQHGAAAQPQHEAPAWLQNAPSSSAEPSENRPPTFDRPTPIQPVPAVRPAFAPAAGQQQAPAPPKTPYAPGTRPAVRPPDPYASTSESPTPAVPAARPSAPDQHAAAPTPHAGMQAIKRVAASSQEVAVQQRVQVAPAAAPAADQTGQVAVQPRVQGAPAAAPAADQTGQVAARPRDTDQVAVRPRDTGQVAARPRDTGQVAVRPRDTGQVAVRPRDPYASTAVSPTPEDRATPLVPAVQASGAQAPAAQQRPLTDVPPKGRPESVLPPYGRPESVLPPYGRPESVLPPYGRPESVLPPHGHPESVLPPHGRPESMLPPTGRSSAAPSSRPSAGSTRSATEPPSAARRSGSHALPGSSRSVPPARMSTRPPPAAVAARRRVVAARLPMPSGAGPYEVARGLTPLFRDTAGRILVAFLRTYDLTVVRRVPFDAVEGDILSSLTAPSDGAPGTYAASHASEIQRWRDAFGASKLEKLQREANLAAAALAFEGLTAEGISQRSANAVVEGLAGSAFGDPDMIMELGRYLYPVCETTAAETFVNMIQVAGEGMPPGLESALEPLFASLREDVAAAALIARDVMSNV